MTVYYIVCETAIQSAIVVVNCANYIWILCITWRLRLYSKVT